MVGKTCRNNDLSLCVFLTARLNKEWNHFPIILFPSEKTLMYQCMRVSVLLYSFSIVPWFFLFGSRCYHYVGNLMSVLKSFFMSDAFTMNISVEYNTESWIYWSNPNFLRYFVTKCCRACLRTTLKAALIVVCPFESTPLMHGSVSNRNNFSFDKIWV